MAFTKVDIDVIRRMHEERESVLARASEAFMYGRHAPRQSQGGIVPIPHPSTLFQSNKVLLLCK